MTKPIDYNWNIDSHVWHTTFGRKDVSAVIFDSGVVELNVPKGFTFVEFDMYDLSELEIKLKAFIRARDFYKRPTGQ